MIELPSICEKIKSIDDLKIILETNEDLVALSRNCNNYYRLNPIGLDSNRKTYSVLSPLKEIQGVILKKILTEVQFPLYLFGGIKGSNYIKDAELHRNSKQIIHADIFHFFDEISGKHIYNIWYDFFKLPHPIASILTNLTINNNKLPQGAKTSTHLSNLVFWRFEPDLVSDFKSKEFIYSRYIDDISISSKNYFSMEEKEYIIRKIIGMMSLMDLKPKRKKLIIETGKSRLSIHNLNLNSGKPTVPKNIRGKIRAATYQLENDVNNCQHLDNILERIKSLEGKIAILHSLHPSEGEKYQNRINQVKCKYQQIHNLDGE